MHKFMIVTLASVTLAFAACGSASVWEQDGQGGTLILRGSEGKAAEEAHELMARHCGTGNYRVTRTYHVIVGQENYASSSTDYDERKDKAADVDTTTNLRQGHHQSQGNSHTTADSTERTAGGSTTNSVAGVRDVSEKRMDYQCGR